MVEWLAGNRIIGTSAERLAFTSGGVSTTTSYGTGTVGEGNTNTSSSIANTYSTGAAPVGYLITQVTFSCRTTNTGASNLLYATIYNSSGTLKDTSTNGINNNALSGSGFTLMTFTFGGTHTLADGDRINLWNTTSGAALRPAQECGLSGSNPALTEHQGGSWNTPNTGCTLKQSVTWKSPLILPALSSGSVFYEKDTNKEYVLNSGVWTKL